MAKKKNKEEMGVKHNPIIKNYFNIEEYENGEIKLQTNITELAKLLGFIEFAKLNIISYTVKNDKLKVE